jgi:site-specific DNA-methyltransferase (adenine-specific)
MRYAANGYSASKAGNTARADSGQMRTESHPAGAPPLDWWEIPTQPYKGSHYATWPEALCVRPILAMCPQRVCVTCGEPSRRIVDAQRTTEADDSTRTKHDGPLARSQDRPPERGWEYERTTLGWSDCGHDTWRRGVVLDPFAGSGTTLAVAEGHGRDSIGIDLDSRNALLARDRVGLWLEVVDAAAA